MNNSLVPFCLLKASGAFDRLTSSLFKRFSRKCSHFLFKHSVSLKLVHEPIKFGLCVQFALWVDAVIFVFSLEDEISFQTVYHYYNRLANFRNTTELPLVLVGTQGLTHALLHTHA